MDFPGNATIKDFTEAMQESATRMTDLTNQLLAYAKGGKYHSKNIAMADFIRKTLPLFKHTINADIQFEVELPSEIYCVAADPTQMQMVLAAVLTNASESCPAPPY